MRWIIIAFAVLSPLTAQADKVFVDDKFFVDYEGVITRRITGAGHEVGSAVSGRLLIDLTKAGDDAYPDDPNQTAFGNENDFITGFIAPSDDWPPSDVVGWLNGRDGGSDFFNLVDGQGADEFNFRRLTIDVTGRRQNLFNDGAPHGFELTGDDSVTFFGEIMKRVNGTVTEWAQFAVNRFSVRAEKCFR